MTPTAKALIESMMEHPNRYRARKPYALAINAVGSALSED